MAHFHLGDGTRFYIKGDSGEEKITLHTGTSIKLKQAGATEVFSDNPSAVEVLDGKKPVFTVKAKGAGTARLKGKDAQGSTISDMSLTVVVGEFKNHNDWPIDLLAEIGRSNNPQRLHMLQRLLNNDSENVISQHSKAIKDKFGSMACGTTCKLGAAALFGVNVDEDYYTYHEPINHVGQGGPCIGISRDAVKYKKATIDKARIAIKRRLGGRYGRPVRVGAVTDPSTCTLSSKGYLQPTEKGGHFVLIVGCNADATQFLYLDPWPSGSILEYKGGIERLAPCKHLGEFSVDYWDRPGSPVLRQNSNTGGINGFLEVIAGPDY